MSPARLTTMRCLRHILTTLALMMVATGCGGSGGGLPADTSNDDGSSDLGPDTTEDTVDDAPADVPVPDPEFTLGINQVFETSPQYFTPLECEQTVPIVLGPQGSNMVVLAFRTTGVFDPDARLHLTGRMTISGMEEGTLQMTDQAMLPGGDGYYYFYNFWLAIAPVDVPTGEPATIEFTAEDLDTGAIAERTVDVVVGEQQ